MKAIREGFEVAALVTIFGALYATEWARKRLKGDRAPVTVFAPIRTYGAR